MNDTLEFLRFIKNMIKMIPSQNVKKMLHYKITVLIQRGLTKQTHL